MKHTHKLVTIYRYGRKLFKGVVIYYDVIASNEGAGKAHKNFKVKAVRDNLSLWRKKQKALSSKKKVR